MAWMIDPAHSTVGFSARHMGLARVRGQFDSFRGEIEGDPTNDITGLRGRLEVDMASINTGNADRDAHLRSPDFFDVERFPTMTFVTTRISPAGEGRYEVAGDLTIKDVTREVVLALEDGGTGVDPYGNRKAGGTLTTTIKRSDWGLTWNVALEAGGVLVSDKITIEIDLQVAESKDAVDEEASAERAA